MPGDISDALLAAAVCSSVEGFGFLLNVEPESYAQCLGLFFPTRFASVYGEKVRDIPEPKYRKVGCLGFRV